MKKIITILLLTGLFSISSFAQVANYIFSQATGPFDTLVGGKVLGSASTAAGTYFADSTVTAGSANVTSGIGLPIGFSFNYNGSNFDVFGVNANGWISFGQSALSPASVDMNTSQVNSPISSTSTAISALQNRVSPFGRNIMAQATSKISYGTIGIAPSRTLVVEWKNYKRTTGGAIDTFSFQIRLHETTNVVEFVYGKMITSSTNSVAQVGLRGQANTDYNIRTTTTNWSSSLAGTNNAATMAITSTVYPAQGLSFLWTPPVFYPNDAGITIINAPTTPVDTGINNVDVTIKNFGTDSLKNASIGWSVNGVLQASYTYSNVGLIQNATEGPITIGTFNFTTAGYYTIKVWTSLPNGLTDGDNSNDTLAKTVYLQGYASIPFYEGFDSLWVNKLNTRDVPSMYWANTPATGNNSWRRNDDGISSSWNNTNFGVYTPTGSNSTAYSARFHTNNATNGISGSIDLYLDMSSSGYKVLRFWYINTTGNDTLSVLLSTDGGITFNLLQKISTVNTWTQEQIQLGSITPSNSIIRFSALKVATNNTDIGIDGVEVFILPPADAGLASIDAPTSIVSGNSPVAVTIKNFGLDTLTSVSVEWSVNGIIQTPYAFFDTIGLPTNATHGPDTIGNYNFNAAGLYTIKAWTSLPNGNTDGNNANDTLIKNVFVQSYANIPFTEGFDSLWINKNSTRDVPSLFWVNTPSTGNISWRRDDDGASASWTNLTTGVYTPAGANSSIHSARFHTGGGISGIMGSLDLCLNFTPIGFKVLKFWHINTAGTDSLTVSFSTDNGNTFNVLQKFAVDATWTQKQIDLGASIDSNVVLRFSAVGNANGNTDPGIDNVEISILPPNDAGIVSIDSPGSVVTGNSPVAVTIKNFGTDSLKTATINWSVNGALQTTFAYTNTPGLAYNAADGPVTLGNFSFSNGFYTIKAWSSNPNSGTDGDNANDTISKIVYAQSFASIPFMEGFDSAWVDKYNTHDVPSLFWVNTPPIGNNSWRRDDDGTSGGWNTTTGAYTPSGTNSSIHSARFHSAATSGSIGTLDLYLNFSTVGTKVLKFWQINTAGTDSLKVYISTNAGNTFTLLQKYNTATVWTERQLLLGTIVDSNVVLRFAALANGGQSDIGLDDVEVSFLPPNDAGLTSIDSPGAVVTGNSPVAVTIMNYGGDSLTSVKVDWTVNGIAQTQYSFTSTPGIATYATNGPVTIGNYNFNTPGFYTIKAWTSNPNLGIDADNTNDTILKTVYSQAYASIPFIEAFDSTWVSKYDTNDVPTAYWRNTPAFGNNSWRRDDDTISGNWTQGTNGAYAPAGADGSIHSARFHTWWAANNTNGILDLYVDLSPSGNKLLDFWNINISGNDSLSVYLSTDGGTSFSFVQKLTVAATWTRNIISIGGSTSANCVVRFRAVSDNGQNDIGLDQVQVYLSPADDMAALNWVSPVGGCGLTNAEHVTVKVINTGTSVKTNIPVKYSINGGSSFVGPETIAGPVNPGDTATYTFTATSDLSVAGTYNCLFVVQNPGDVFTLNDTAFMSINSIGTVAGNPFIDNLELGNNYYILTNSTNSAVALSAGVGNLGTYGFDMTGGAQGTWPQGTSVTTTPQQAFSYVDHIARIKPCSVDATAFTTNQLYLKLDLKQTHSQGGNKYSYFMVVVNGTDTIADFNGTKFFNAQTTNSDPFTTRFFNLASYTGQIFSMEFVSSCKYSDASFTPADHVYLDNIALYIPPVINDLGPDTSICQGSSITFDAGPGTGYTYEWTEQPAGSIIGNSQTITASTSGTYQVVVTNNLGLSAIDNVTLTVVPAPVVDAGLDTTITYLAAANLHSTVIGSGNYTYAWSPADSLVDATVQNPVTVALHASQIFNLNVTDNNTGCVGSDQVIVFVTGGTLTVSAFATPDTICSGGQVTLQALPSGGTGTYTYNWTSTPAGFTSTLITDTDNPTANTNYLVNISDGVSTATASVNVIVHQLPVVNLGNDTTLCTYSTITLSAGSGSTYLWSNGAITQSIIVDSNFAIAGVAKVWVAVTNQFGCVKSDTINITFVTCPGIDEYSNSITLALYPNPTNGMTNILVNGLNAEADLAIYSLQGKLVYSGNIAGNGLTTLDLSNLSKGIYMVRIQNEHSNLISKLIKQ
jgi:hypothetical protein